jgi:hypothetical protein
MDVKIKMLVAMAGVNHSHRAGDILTVRPEVAEAWSKAGLAVPVDAQAASTSPANPGVARATPPDQKPLDKMKKAELVELATSLGVGKADDLKVAELIVAIEAKRKEG